MAGAAITVYDETGLTVVEFLPFHPLASSVLLSELYTADAVATEFPVEEGVNVSDHVKPGNEIVTLEVFVTRTPHRPDLIRANGRKQITKLDLQTPFNPISDGPPIGAPGFATRSASNAIYGRVTPPQVFAYTLVFDEFNPVSDVNQLLSDIRTESKLCSVLTTIDELTDMALVNFDRVRGSQEGTGAKFSLSFKKIKKATSLTVVAPKPVEPRAQPKVDKGTQGPEQANPRNLTPEERKSLLAKAVDGLL